MRHASNRRPSAASTTGVVSSKRRPGAALCSGVLHAPPPLPPPPPRPPPPPPPRPPPRFPRAFSLAARLAARTASIAKRRSSGTCTRNGCTAGIAAMPPASSRAFPDPPCAHIAAWRALRSLGVALTPICCSICLARARVPAPERTHMKPAFTKPISDDGAGCAPCERASERSQARHAHARLSELQTVLHLYQTTAYHRPSAHATVRRGQARPRWRVRTLCGECGRCVSPMRREARLSWRVRTLCEPYEKRSTTVVESADAV
jgi:hypothetical protein